MTETLAAMPPTDETPVVEPCSSATAVLFEEPSPPVAPSQRAVIAQLVKAARARGEELTGPDGLLKALTKTVLETALDEEMAEHLGYDKHAVAGRNGGNSRNGTPARRRVLTDHVGPVTIDVPRDRDSSFTPVIVKKRQRRLGDVDTVVLSLYAKGLTTGEISSAFAAVGAIAVLAGLVGVLFPNTLPKEGDALAWLILVIGVVFGLLRAWPRSVQATFNSPRTKITIVRGNLFDETAHLVIGMTDTFDTADDVIARTSLQAQFLDVIFGGDVDRFDAELEKALADYAPIERIEKPGKGERYPLGTVAALGEPARRFFCVAYSQMNLLNEARATVDGVWTSLSSLWKAVCTFANGGPVAMPVIGGGQSRLSQSLSSVDAIRLQVLWFWLASRVERLCDELRIVVQPSDYDKLDVRELRVFLDGLKPS